ncbi:MAG: DUF2339 domain-containing protein [Campylobacteraceae bacterium]|jgi:uncharacterized membrane protein|nr:DUF2339 domain-containing protein [Campylobacteraceae bacterium]
MYFSDMFYIFGVVGLVVFLFIAALVVFPIIAIVMVNNLKQRVKYLEKRFDAVFQESKADIKPETEPFEATEAIKSTSCESISPSVKDVPHPLNALANSGARPRLKKIQRTAPFSSAQSDDMQFDNLKSKFLNWLGQNFVAKIAVVILFFGISFLLKYSIEHGLLSPEVRVLGSLILGFALFGVGWRLRKTKEIYSLILQGGGVGVLYLTIFAAFKLYAFIPASTAFVLLIVICALSVYFAVLQCAISLAILAFAGAYLSPVLLSSGRGEHVVLFSFYTIISLALVVISRWRSWRVLNLVGFAFTAVVTSLWYIKSYKIEFFPETQAFIIANLLIFGILAVLLFIRHERKSAYHNAADVVFLFGVPLLSYVLEYHILSHLEFAPAFAALAFGLFYIAGSFTVFKKFKDVGRRAALYMLAIGIGFTTLAVPLAFDNDLTSLIWLFEGSAVTWAALRNNQYKLGYFGLLITLFGAALLMYDNQNAFDWYYLSLFESGFYTPVLSYGIMSVILFFNACLLYSFKNLHKSLKPVSFALLIMAAIVWIYWTIGSSNAINYIYFDYFNGFKFIYILLAFTASSWVWYFVGKAMKWEMLECALISLWPAVVYVVWQQFAYKSLLLDMSFLLSFASAYLYLYKGSFFRQLHKNVEVILHISLFWATLLWIYGRLELFEYSFIPWHYQEYLSWSLFGAVFAAVILVVYAFQKKDLFPFNRFLHGYWRIGLAPVVFFLVVKLFSALFTGYEFSLQYIPILNPLEEGVIFVLLVLKFYLDKTLQDGQNRFVFFAYLFFAFICFLEINSVILRTLTCFLDMPWSFYYLWNSEAVQSVLSIVWTLLALALIVFANKSKNRKIWFVGMALLVIVVIKLVLHDSVKLEGLFRAFVFIGVALLMLVIGFLAPIPPKEITNKD